MLPDLLIFDCKYLTSLDTWPSVPVMLGQFFLFMLVEDCVFYLSHSLLHHPSLYWIHKQHHEYYNTICIAAVYAHPVEAVLGNMVPMYLGYRVLSVYAPVHMVTICVWLLFRMMETYENHSGYEWSWGQLSFLPWKLGSDYHNFHHSHNVGNFGSMFGFWDTIMGTNAHYLKFKKTQ
jgi:sterol desaturase/sphingolipid hydroxylase (fatty acid hydroxylase superfamily)